MVPQLNRVTATPSRLISIALRKKYESCSAPPRDNFQEFINSRVEEPPLDKTKIALQRSGQSAAMIEFTANVRDCMGSLAGFFKFACFIVEFQEAAGAVK